MNEPLKISKPGCLETTSPPPDVPNHEVLKWIGGGSYGEVWLARNIMGAYRAIKVVRRARFESDKPYNREFNGVRNFEPVSRTHDGFMDVLQVGRNEDGYFFYVMEAADDQVSGQNIDAAIYQPRTLMSDLKQANRLPFEVCLRIALSLTDSLRHLHAHGLVHRDIKPSNIIFVNEIPKLADIGLVTSQTNSETYIGAPGYIPPEGPGSPKADIFALGKVLYELMTGNDRLEYPKLPANIEDRDLATFQELNNVVLKACETDPRSRYSSADEIYNDLVLLQGGKSVIRLRRLERTVKVAAYASGIGLLGFLAAFLVQHVIGQEQRREQRRDLMIQKLITSRLTERMAGWSSEAWEQARQAASIRSEGRNHELRDQTAALLAGLDAQRELSTDVAGSSVHFDASGKLLLIGGFRKAFYGREITDIAMLASRLSGPSDAISAFVRGKLRAVTTNYLRRYQQSASNQGSQMESAGGSESSPGADLATTERCLKRDLAIDLNGLVKGPCIYDPQRFHGITLSHEVESLLSEPLEGEKLEDLNRLLLEAAYPRELLQRGNRPDYGIKLWDTSSSAVHTLIQSPTGAAAFDNNGMTAELFYDAEHEVLAQAKLGGAIIRQWQLPLQDEPPRTALSHDGTIGLVVFRATDGRETLATVTDGALHSLANFEIPVSAIAISPEGSLAAVAQNGGILSVWNVKTGEQTVAPATDRTEILCLSFKHTNRTRESKAGRQPLEGRWLLAAGHLGGNITIWDLDSRTTVSKCNGNYIRTSAVAFNPDGTILASGGRGKVKLWDVATGQHLLDIGADFATDLEFSPDGTRLAIATVDMEPNVSIWRIDFGRGIQTLLGLSAQVEKVCFSPNGSQVAALAHNWQIGLWDVQTRRLLRIFEAPQEGEYPDNANLTFSPNGERLAFAGENSAKLWDVDSGLELGSWEFSPGLVNIPRFFNDQELLLFRAEGLHRAKKAFWDVSSDIDPPVCRIRGLTLPHQSNLLTEIHDFSRRVLSAAAPPDGRCFVIAGTAEPDSGVAINCYDSHNGTVRWPLPVQKATTSFTLVPDSSGTQIAVESQIVDLDAGPGPAAQSLPEGPSALDRDGSIYVTRVSDNRGFCIHAGSNSVLNVAIDATVTASPALDATGNLLAWGHENGTVGVCDLNEVGKRLVPVGLAWSGFAKH